MEENRTETEDIEEVWKQQRNAYVSAAEGVLGLGKGRCKPWISDSTWKMIDERKETKIRIDSTRSERIKNRMKEEYKEKDREVKRNVREDKRRWVAEKAQRAQAAAENGRQKELYSIVKQLTGHNNRQVAAVRSKDGELLKNMEARKKKWKEHFQKVLNRDAPEEPPQEEEGEELDISTEPPMLQEIKMH